MTEKGMSLKELRDEMARVLSERRPTPIIEVQRWVNALDQIMQMPEFDPNQMDMFPAPRARATDPATSHHAAEEVTKYDLNEMRGNILYLIAAFGAMTDPEIRERYKANFEKEFAESTIRTRRNECVMMGWLKPMPGENTRFTRWDVTGIGWDALTHWRSDEDQSGE